MQNTSTPGAVSFGVQQDLHLDSFQPIPLPVSVAVGSYPGAFGPFVACADFANGRIVVFQTDRTTYDTGTAYSVEGRESQPASLVAADLNADGRDDLVVALRFADTIGVLGGLLGGSFTPPMLLPSGLSPLSLISADIDGNGLPDIVEIGGAGSSSHLRVIFSNCGGM